ncbi:MAG: hypothetical protein AB8G96_17500 [Phycisphaerales bacterium]
MPAPRRTITIANLALAGLAGLAITGLTLASAAVATTGLQAAPPAAQAAKAPAAEVPPVFGPAERDLDERIDPTRITRMDLPPLPERLMLPMPPDHRTAGAAEQVPISPEHWAAAQAAIARGLESLAASQAENGQWMNAVRTAPTDQPTRGDSVSVAVTAMAMRAFAQSSASHPHAEAFARARHAVLSARQADGSFGAGPLGNYVTSVAISALAAVGEPESRDFALEGARWLMDSQWDQGEGLQPEQDWFGGAGYGRNGRPDLSNTQMMLEALYDAGVSPDEPAVQRALAFVARTQNLAGTNPATWAGNDGGFIYTPAGGGESMASEAAGEGRRGELLPEEAPRALRSYGSMSYAGFKSLLYAGLGSEDPRVRAVFDWIRRNYSFDENPGLGQQGVFYYFHAAARALRVGQQVTIDSIEDGPRNWREDLIDALVARQDERGGWTNPTDRWLESERPLSTAYAVLALQEALKPVTFPAPSRPSGEDRD